jgi:hypothetical protein
MKYFTSSPSLGIMLSAPLVLSLRLFYREAELRLFDRFPAGNLFYRFARSNSYNVYNS